MDSFPLGRMVDLDNKTKGWYTVSIPISKASQLEDILLWIDSNIDGSDKHTYFKTVDGKLEVRFRHKKSFEWFVLRWS